MSPGQVILQLNLTELNKEQLRGEKRTIICDYLSGTVTE